MPARKGQKKAGGRQKGTPNKNTKALKDMILDALDGAGGVAYLRQQAKENPSAFMTLVGKVLPLQIAGDPHNPIKFTEVRETIVDPQHPGPAGVSAPAEAGAL